MNINPSDGHDFGWGAWPTDLNEGSYVGSLATSLTSDFADGAVWNSPANYIAIVRHDGSTCQAARVWRLVSSDLSMRSIFTSSSSYQRERITTGGVQQEVQKTLIANDPVFGVGTDIVANWWYSNNGARLAMDKPEMGGGQPLSYACEGCNTDDVHGLGNEFGAATHSGGYASSYSYTTSWWHDASVIQADCHGTPCMVQGTDHGASLVDGTKLGNYAIYVSANAYDASAPVVACDSMAAITAAPPPSVPPGWSLAMNINPSDGHDFGWGAWPTDLNEGSYVGSLATSLTSDFADGAVWNSPANYIAIVRHDGSTCQAARVWRLVSSDLSMRSIFTSSSSYQRERITTGGVQQEVQKTLIANDPVFGVGTDIVANWWYSNNGARLAMDKPEMGGGQPLSYACEGCNTDDVHGLGNEFGAATHSGGYASSYSYTTSWWHDASVIQADCHGTPCMVQGTDHGASLVDGTKLGNYAIYVSANAYDASAPVVACDSMAAITAAPPPSVPPYSPAPSFPPYSPGPSFPPYSPVPSRPPASPMPFSPPASPAPSAPPATFSVHGDPIFKFNGTGTHFWVKEGVLTPLLTWPSSDGHVLELSGRTFARTATGDQWFKELVLGNNGDVVLTLTAQSAHKKSGPMLVHKSANTTAVNITVHEAKGQSGGRQWAESVEVTANGIAFSVKSASATKFAHNGPRDEFHHLNLDFPHGVNTGIGATGIFAQLARVEPMLAATKEMLKRPVTEKQKHARHARQVVRKKTTARNERIKATRYQNNDHSNPGS